MARGYFSKLMVQSSGKPLFQRATDALATHAAAKPPRELLEVRSKQLSASVQAEPARAEVPPSANMATPPVKHQSFEPEQTTITASNAMISDMITRAVPSPAKMQEQPQASTTAARKRPDFADHQRLIDEKTLRLALEWVRGPDTTTTAVPRENTASPGEIPISSREAGNEQDVSPDLPQKSPAILQQLIAKPEQPTSKLPPEQATRNQAPERESTIESEVQVSIGTIQVVVEAPTTTSMTAPPARPETGARRETTPHTSRLSRANLALS